MASLRTDVDQKLKAAISTRLGEMGLYVDDQLPNYIMVMITNKRSKKEMDKELQLFLGDETNRFTTWLQSVTNKIEDATSAKSILKRKNSDGDQKKKKKKLKKNYSSDSDSDVEKKKKFKSGAVQHNFDGKHNSRSGTSGYKSDASIDENLHIGIDRYLNTRGEKNVLKDISPDTTTTVMNVKAHKNEKLDSADKRTLREVDDEEDFLNIREEDIYDFFNDKDENGVNVVNKTKSQLTESIAGKSEKVQSTSSDVATSKALLRMEKKASAVNINDGRKNASSNDFHSNSSATTLGIVQPSKLKPIIATRQNVKYVGAGNEVNSVNKTAVSAEIKTGKAVAAVSSEQQSLKQRGDRDRSSSLLLKKQSIHSIGTGGPPVVVTKGGSSHRGETDKRSSLLLDDDSSLDAREFINRKRGILKIDRHRGPDDVQQPGRSRFSNEKEPPAQLATRGIVDNRHRMLKSDRSSSSSERRYLESKRFESINENDDNKYSGRRGKYDKFGDGKQQRSSNVINNEKTVDVTRAKNFLRSDGDIIRIKRVITNKKRYNNSSEDDDSTNETRRVRGKHILPSDTPEESAKKRKQVDSMATLPQKVARPRLSPTGSANTNLVRKAFEDVQRSLSSKEKPVHSKRISRTVLRGDKTQKFARTLSPTIHEIRDEKDRHVPEQHSKYEQQPQQEQHQSKQNNGMYYSSYADEINIYESSPKITKPLSKALESHQAKPLKESMVQRVINMARSAARQKQPVEEYVPENTTPQFVVTLTGLDPNAYPNTPETAGKEIITTKIPNNIVIDPANAGVVTTDKKSIIKKAERCKYWPNCLNVECPYAHPTTPCTMFPNCKFGKACLYIHPKCRFDTMCTRYDCPFTHAGSSVGSSIGFSSAPTGSMMKSTVSFKVPTACKFYPNCVNTACPFQHPRICRFDKFCSNRNCTFSHTSRNKMLNGKLKWVNPQMQTNVNNNNASVMSVITDESVSSETSVAVAATGSSDAADELASESPPKSPSEFAPSVDNDDVDAVVQDAVQNIEPSQ